MRLLPIIIFMLAGSLVAAEPTAYPLWDGHESVADYAKKVNMLRRRRWIWAAG